jgi:hypothetical protein
MVTMTWRHGMNIEYNIKCKINGVSSTILEERRIKGAEEAPTWNFWSA